MSFKDNRKALDRFKRKIDSVEKMRLRVGVIGPKASAPHRGSKMTVAEIAAFHEFGFSAPKVPKRSFIRGWFDKKPQRFYADQLNKAVQDGIKSSNVRAQVGRLGALYQGQIQDFISQGIKPPLAASTIKRRAAKGISVDKVTPLIDTGQLRTSITWDIEAA